MAVQVPGSAGEISQKIKVDVRSELTGSNPFVNNSWLLAFIVGIANRLFDFYLQLKEAEKQSNPATATGGAATAWAGVWSITTLPATASTGVGVATGNTGAPIPQGTIYADTLGQTYISTSAVVVVGASITLLSLTRVGGLVTAVTVGPHNLANNIPVTISGAVETEYNLVGVEIAVIDPLTFTYDIATTPLSPATGSIIASGEFALVPLDSQGFGVSVNQGLNAALTVQSPVPGINDALNINSGLLSGAADQETEAQRKVRLDDRLQNPLAHFNVADVISKAKEVLGVTRVFVKRVTPAKGQVTIYFMRDNDASPIPTAAQVAIVKSKIEEIVPVTTSLSDVFVFAPTPVTTDFVFTSLTPDTPAMRVAVTANLQQFFEEGTTEGVDVDEDKYKAAISNSVDINSGQGVAEFSMSSPLGDIPVLTGEIGVLGDVTYP